MRNVHANAWNVVVSPTEIALLFGVERERDAVRREISVELSDRIILTPRAAKRLTHDLKAVLREYEAKYGTLEPPAPSRAPRRPMRIADVLPVVTTGEMAGRVGEILRLVQALDVELGLERSFKMSRGSLQENRFLVTLAKNAIPAAPAERILEISRQLGMPEPLSRLFAARLPEANYIHLGFEESSQSALYKMYLEFWTDWEHEIRSWPTRRDPFVLYLGFKWDCACKGRPALSTYTCHPRISLEQIGHRVGLLLDSPVHRGSRDMLLDLLELAARRIGPEQLLYLEVTEAENPRHSFDINFYKANLRLEELGELLERVCLHYGAPIERFRALCGRVKGKRFGHVSGGVDRTGNDFLTIYYGARSY